MAWAAPSSRERSDMPGLSVDLSRGLAYGTETRDVAAVHGASRSLANRSWSPPQAKRG